MTALATPRHRVSVAIAQMRATATAVADASVWSLSTDEAAQTLVELTRLEAQVAELKARVAAHADAIEVGADLAASSTANWLSHQTKLTRRAANAAVRLGHDLEAHSVTRDALAAGEVHAEQATVIVRAVDALPDDLDAETVAKAEAFLLEEAQHRDAKELTVLGKHLLEVVAPEVADAHEAAILEAEEREAEKAYRLTMVDDGHGKTHGRFTLPTYQGAALKKALLAIMAPKHQHATHGAGAPRLVGPEAIGRAFGEYITRYPTKKLPKAGGLNAAVVVTMTLETLEGRIEKAGILDTGEKISPALARRIACEAGIIPAVLGGPFVVLDMGRKQRLYSDYQRIAMMLRDQGCTAEGCDRPPGMTHAHHDQRWADGGPTDIEHGRLLCPWHHSRAHDTNYEMRHLPNGKVTFHRRT